MLVNADLHIHSRFSIATSKKMELPTLALEAARKVIQILGTGDCLHPEWLREIRHLEKIDEGTFGLSNIRFVLTTEVEDEKRVHHLLIFPSLDAVDSFISSLAGKSADL
jgi:PHP family Zn ribbon phosphoesterase